MTRVFLQVVQFYSDLYARLRALRRARPARRDGSVPPAPGGGPNRHPHPPRHPRLSAAAHIGEWGKPLCPGVHGGADAYAHPRAPPARHLAAGVRLRRGRRPSPAGSRHPVVHSRHPRPAQRRAAARVTASTGRSAPGGLVAFGRITNRASRCGPPRKAIRRFPVPRVLPRCRLRRGPAAHRQSRGTPACAPSPASSTTASPAAPTREGARTTAPGRAGAAGHAGRFLFDRPQQIERLAGFCERARRSSSRPTTPSCSATGGSKARSGSISCCASWPATRTTSRPSCRRNTSTASATCRPSSRRNVRGARAGFTRSGSTAATTGFIPTCTPPPSA